MSVLEVVLYLSWRSFCTYPGGYFVAVLEAFVPVLEVVLYLSCRLFCTSIGGFLCLL